MYLSSGVPIAPNIATILERNNGEILIGTSGHSMFLLETRGDSIKATQISQFISSNLITYTYEDKKGNLWVATGDNGIFRFDKNNQAKHYSGEEDIAKNTVSSMCEDEQGNLYMSSLKKGYSYMMIKQIHLFLSNILQILIYLLRFYILEIRMRYLSVPMVWE